MGLLTGGTRHARLCVSAPELLGRGHDAVYGAAARALVKGRRVLVTGAGGSIGSEIVRQLHTLAPGAVYLLDHDESALHSLQLELVGHGLLDSEHTVLADVRDRAGILRVMTNLRPELVFHVAAHKHLPLLERYPAEGFKTNVLGTDNVVSAAVEAGVERFVNVSTDKAARPVSILGATKRLAELLVASFGGSDTRVASVRFGNVLGSRGSFLHSLAYQVENAKPVTITDKDVTRFFMTIPEAAGLVIESAVMAESGETYVLDMGAPVRIIDLVDRYVTLVGAQSPRVTFTGLRSGEKLHEELLDDAEEWDLTAHPRIWLVRGRHEVIERVSERAHALLGLTVQGRVRELRHALFDLLALPTYPRQVSLAAPGVPDSDRPDVIFA